MKWTRAIAILKHAASVGVTVLLAWWTYSAKMAEVEVEKMKLRLELERRVEQVEQMRVELYE